MAKNIPDKVSNIIKIKRHLNEPHMPYISENKLDHAMYELRLARQEVLKFRNYLYASCAINAVGLVSLGLFFWVR
jgi:hypothetical protein